MMAEDMDEVTLESGGKESPKRGLLFELEYFSVPGWQMMFDAIRGVLAKKHVELTQVAFSRYCLLARMHNALPRLLKALGGSKLQSAKALADIEKTYLSSFAAIGRGDDAAIALLKKARKGGVALGAVTDLGVETSEALLTALGFEEGEIGLVRCVPEENRFPSANDWLRLAKSISVKPSLCTVVSTGSNAAKSALAACMRCFVFSNKFTEWEDFSGADCVVDQLDSSATKRLFEILNSR